MSGPSTGPIATDTSFGNLSFSRKRKLTSPAEFDRVFKDNQYRVSGAELLILAAPNDLGYSRLGMVIGKKALNLAPHRNALKRRLRETFRHLDLPAIDIVVLARPGIKQQPLSTWQQLTNNAFSRLQKKMGTSNP